MISFERIFDQDNTTKSQKDTLDTSGGKCDPSNLGNEKDKREVFIGYVCTTEEINDIGKALKYYRKVIT